MTFASVVLGLLLGAPTLVTQAQDAKVRDPFSRAEAEPEPRGTACPVPPPRGYRIRETTLEGIVTTRSGLRALVHFEDGKSVVLERGDRFFDGVVEAVESDRVRLTIDAGLGACPDSSCWEDEEKPKPQKATLTLKRPKISYR